VRALVTNLREQVEAGYADVWVEGEISNCRPAPSGHIYFTLKDGEAQLPVVLFRRQAQLLRFRPQDGLAVLVRGHVSVYESRGQLQLVGETLEPRGAGALQLAYEQLKARLLAEGLFDAARKRSLPPFPHCIGVITSTGGAVLHDIVKVVRRRHARLNLLIYPALMQGPECAASVAAGIRFFNRHPEQADVILIARGGGSIEDLAGFNDEGLARAIAASELPVVSAVGHETDFTIADFVADLRAPTPSAAAELITAAQHGIEERVRSMENRVMRAMRYQLILARQRLAASSLPQMHSRVQVAIGRRGQRLDDLTRRLDSAIGRRLRVATGKSAALTARLDRHNPAVRLALARRRLESARQALDRCAASSLAARAAQLNHASARLEALSPLAVLKRGYALIYAVDGRLLRDAAETRPGESIRARLAGGALDAEVTKILETN
jgi:exodeoxyribonuclease VII large subunit